MDNQQNGSLPIETPQTNSPSSKPNKKKVVLVLLAVVLFLASVGGVYYWQNSKNKDLQSQLDTTKTQLAELQKSSTQPTTTTTDTSKKTYDPAITAQIGGFDLASDSLKDALVNNYFAEAKKNCDIANADLSADAQITTVMVVGKMVRDDFAGVQFCGSGGTSIFVHTNGEWKVVGSLAMAPGCAVVDQYKISKEITTACFTGSGSETRTVTYP